MASVRASTEQRFEIIVVDDGSDIPDWQAALALADANTHILQRCNGLKGPSRCRNLGVARAQGDYILFLDSDDLLAPWCLEQRLKQAIQTPEADFWVFPVLLFKEYPGDCDLLWNAMGDLAEAADRFARSDPPWHTSSPLWKREALLRLCGFNEAVFYGDDSDLHLRALVTGLRIELHPDALPDCFIRRSDTPRITNSITPALIESRRLRLREGSRFLRGHPEAWHLWAAWDGQYFVEAEFLLFNHRPSKAAIQHVLSDWIIDCSPPAGRRWIVTSYLRIARLSRDRAYLILRLARRLAMNFLPESNFPRGGEFHAAKAGSDVMARLHALGWSKGEIASEMKFPA